MLTRRLSLVDSQMDAKVMTVVLLAVFLACLVSSAECKHTHIYHVFQNPSDKMCSHDVARDARFAGDGDNMVRSAARLQ